MLSLYRYVMLAAIAVVLAASVMEAFFPPQRVSFGLPSRGFEAGAPLRWVLEKTPPKKSPAGRAGIRRGDTVALLSPYADFRRGTPVAGNPIRVEITDLGIKREATLVAVPAGPLPPGDVIDKLTPALKLVTQLLMLLVAGLLVFVRSDLRYSRSLAAFFVAFAFQLSFNPFPRFQGPLMIAGHFALNFSIVFALTQVLRFATSFPEAHRVDLDRWGLRHLIFRIAPYFGLFMAIDTTLEIGQQYLYGAYTPLFDNLWWSSWAFALLSTIIALAVALSRAEGSDKQRLLYITVTFLVGFLGPIIGTLAVVLQFDYDTSTRWRLTSLIIPFGFGYAILRHRVIDIGYAVSRAVVFGVFLALIVPLFAVVEYFIENYIAGSNGQIEVAVKSCLLLIVGFGLPQVLRRIDDFVDETLFRERRAAKIALRSFAHQLQFVSELEILMQLTLQTITKNARATTTAIYLAEDGGKSYRAKIAESNEMPPPVGENDPAVLQMRASGTSVDLTATTTELHGAEAFPMVVRGSLLGFIVLGQKQRRENYTPDEITALEGLAQATGAAIDVRIANSERERAQAENIEQQARALEEMSALNRASARFVPQAFLQRLGKSTIVDVELGNQVQGDMTIMFTDIRGFTSLSEKMTPQETFAFLNAYLGRIGPVIRNHGGLIDKYIGDGLMALFPDRADDAVHAALAVLGELRTFNRLRMREGKEPIRVGLGIHSGHLMLGTIGETERMDTTVISDAVNLASRMEGVTKHLGTTLVISEATVLQLEDPEEYRLRPLGALAVVGKSDGIETFEVYDADSPASLLHKDVTLDRFAVAIEHYGSGRFDLALPIFEEIVAAYPHDGPAQFFYERSKLRAAGGSTGSGWDGVERLLAK